MARDFGNFQVQLDKFSFQVRFWNTTVVQAELQSSQVGPKLSLKVLLKDFLTIPILSPSSLSSTCSLSLSSTCCSSPLLEYGPKTWKLALKSRDGRHLAADCYECKTSKQFFKIKYRLPLLVCKLKAVTCRFVSPLRGLLFKNRFEKYTVTPTSNKKFSTRNPAVFL